MPQPWSDIAAPRVGGGRSQPFASAADRRACRLAIRTGSRSFYAASLMLPARLRDPAYALYAFCRLSDDAVDLEEGGPGARFASVARLRDRLDRAYAGQPVDAPADRALADAVWRFDIPRALPEALLEGLAWDAEGRRYETMSDLRDYAARVAGAVGAMMAALMDARTPELAARACDLGVAMQLTNIARDIGEDARAGRIYLPLSWLREAGIAPEDLLYYPEATPALRQVTARLLREADRLYARAEPGIAALPSGCRSAIWSARLIYAEIGAEVARNGFDSVAQRAATTSGRKLALAGRAARLSVAGVGRGAIEAGLTASALPEVRFLVNPLAATAAARARPPAWWAMGDRIVRVIEMIQALDERELAARGLPPEAMERNFSGRKP
ncbi:MAG: phytoene/squalene synthase family protein [Rhodobacteraceae bacterium]|nr:phytoene/squalene synthase family protein [Paracoccaceae bacterium]